MDLIVVVAFDESLKGTSEERQHALGEGLSLEGVK